ncbi:hypothetical protein GCM10023080_098860 [Streptomyces pseudoechinosporeus]
MDAQGKLYAIDFEGACYIDDRRESPWGSPGYLIPKVTDMELSDRWRFQDVYAVGATIHHSLTGRMPLSDASLPPVGKLRRGIPSVVRKLLGGVLSGNPKRMPNLRDLAAGLEEGRRMV